MRIQQTTSMYRLANELFMKISRAAVVSDEVARKRREPARLTESCAASPAIDLIGLSPVPVGAQISPHAHEFCASLRRIVDVADSLAGEEGV